MGKFAMKAQSALVYSVPLIVLCLSCPLSRSFQHQGPVAARLGVKEALVLRNKESDDIDHVWQLLRKSDIDPETCRLESLSGPGFCNALYKVQFGRTMASPRTVLLIEGKVFPTHHRFSSCIQMVAKIFSIIAKQRMGNHHCRIDWMASRRGLGPKLVASTKDGILMEWLSGEELNETIVHSSTDWIETVAPQLAEFHTMEIPPRPPHMLWLTMDIMMDMTQDASLVRDEVLRQHDLLEPLNLPVVLGHGDLKPSNVMVDRFIDFEVSGMHYRGFDLAKLFRTDHPTGMSDEIMNAFIECYLQATFIPFVDAKRRFEQLKLETKLMQPLTVSFKC